MPLPHRGIAFTVYSTGTTTSVRSTVMMWHTAIDSQRLALRGEPVMLLRGRSAQPSNSREARLGDSREAQGIRRE
jgi:hypothetical protein